MSRSSFVRATLGAFAVAALIGFASPALAMPAPTNGGVAELPVASADWHPWGYWRPWRYGYRHAHYWRPHHAWRCWPGPWGHERCGWVRAW